jgi:hypothetical protein
LGSSIHFSHKKFNINTIYGEKIDFMTKSLIKVKFSVDLSFGLGKRQPSWSFTGPLFAQIGREFVMIVTLLSAIAGT